MGAVMTRRNVFGKMDLEDMLSYLRLRRKFSFVLHLEADDWYRDVKLYLGTGKTKNLLNRHETRRIRNQATKFRISGDHLYRDIVMAPPKEGTNTYL